MGRRLLEALRQLSAERFLSGEEIAQRLHCSRATIHNALQEADAAGVRIQAVRGRGYRLAAPLDWLDGERLKATLAARGLHPQVFDILPSSNTLLMEQARQDAPHRSVVIVDWQTGGRGRRGRAWLAPPGTGVQFSVLWRFRRSVAELSGLSLAVGVMLARTLADQGQKGLGLKWPNDLLRDGTKLAGVLIELAGDMLGPASAVIGVGLNTAGSEEIGRQVGHPVAQLAAQADRSDLALTLLAALDEGLARFDAEGFAAFREDWHALHAHQNVPVRLDSGSGSSVTGIALGVDAQGALRLALDGGERLFHAGEVSLRAA
jgi:BirA family biotin operon repressor/biotin-[acetyl-CoA-carboxylase] ligase